MPNGGACGLTAMARTVLTGAPPPPARSNLLVSTPDAPPPTATSITNRKKCFETTVCVVRQSSVPAPATGEAPSPAVHVNKLPGLSATLTAVIPGASVTCKSIALPSVAASPTFVACTTNCDVPPAGAVEFETASSIHAGPCAAAATPETAHMTAASAIA